MGDDKTNSGYIKLYRSLLDHWLWQPGNELKLKWWLTLLLEVNHSSQKINIGNNVYECKRGQSIKSIMTRAKEWHTSKDTVRNFYTLLTRENMILIENLGKTTRITVCNYESYQGSLHDCLPIAFRSPSDTSPQTKNVKNVKNDKKNNTHTGDENFSLENSNLYRKPVIPEKENVEMVFKQQGGTKEMSEKFFETMSAVEWYYKGSPVTNFVGLVPGYIDAWKKNESKVRNFKVTEQVKTQNLPNGNELAKKYN